MLSPELLQLYVHLLSQQNETAQSSTDNDPGKKISSTEVKSTDTQNTIQQTIATNAILQQVRLYVYRTLYNKWAIGHWKKKEAIVTEVNECSRAHWHSSSL